MTRFKTVFLSSVAIAGVAATLAVRHQTRTKLRANEMVLREQADELKSLADERQRLSFVVAAERARSDSDRLTELEQLRARAEALRRQTNNLARLRLAEQQSTGRAKDLLLLQPASAEGQVVSASDSEEYKVQLQQMASASPHAPPHTNNHTFRDARNLRYALSKYAKEHGGEFPATLEQAAPYFFEGEPLPRTSEFEMVYQGSLDDLANVPLQAVALIRERQVWPTPSGKWARVYVMVWGDVKVVESDDGFRAWEAQHLVPPPRGKR